jgi:hypothetical protein
MYAKAEIKAPNHVKFSKKKKRTIVPKPKTRPTKGKKNNMEAKTSLLDKLSDFVKGMGNMEKYEKENLNPK